MSRPHDPGRQVTGPAIAVFPDLIAASFAAPARNARTPDSIARQGATRFDVAFLPGLQAGNDGRRIRIVTVMTPGGNSNTAFRVTSPMVHRTTGERVSQFSPGAGSYSLLDEVRRGATAADGRTIRRLSVPDPTGRAGE